MPMPKADLSAFEYCADVDCVVDATDNIPEDQRECVRPKWMEGYRMPSLRWLIDNGRLTIDTIPDWKKVPLILFAGRQGETLLSWGHYGDFHSAKVSYMTGGDWQLVLAHELMHVAGPCLDSWWPQYIVQANLPGMGYTKKQKAIMKTEGVSRWTDTKFYKREDSFWHLPNKQ